MVGKAHTSTAERMNRLLHHYLARFARKTYCWPKSLAMMENSILLFMNKCIF
ncbi:MAG: IS1 family transposase, partial [Oscillospiraceae bacterium]|nr:IS1 family transposase [Oscillospiraceae bacterium]